MSKKIEIMVTDGGLQRNPGPLGAFGVGPYNFR